MNLYTRSRRMAAILLVAALSACGGGSDPVELPLKRLDGLGYQAWPTKTYVIRTQTEWEATWNERIEPIDSSASRPTVDFTQDALVAVSAGWTGGCDNFGVTRITRYGQDLVVEWHLSPPPAGTGCGGVLSPLYDFIAVPASIHGRVDFVKTN